MLMSAEGRKEKIMDDAYYTPRQLINDIEKMQEFSMMQLQRSQPPETAAYYKGIRFATTEILRTAKHLEGATT